jgi:pimeloyl-ACP methyl ester carboxylesterase
MRAIGVAIALSASLAAPAHASEPLAPCPAPDSGWLCGAVTVPLDRSGALTGTIDVHYAVQAGTAPVLLFLSGGPGQADLAYKARRAVDFRGLAGRYRVAVLDYRGSGQSGVINCPALQIQATDRTVDACAQALGPARAFYTTFDQVLDIEEVRKAIGVPSLALVGSSYGTYVAQQYARAFPTQVERLILNSTVGPDGAPAYGPQLQSLASALRSQCPPAACRSATPDPVADLNAVVARAPLNERQLAQLLVRADLNPYLQALLPGAMRAAATGRPSALLRLHNWGTNPAAYAAQQPPPELSMGLFFATTCQETALPFAVDSPLEDRARLVAAATPSVPPFSRETVRASSNAQVCMSWPPTPPRPRISGPLPDVPTLILSGNRDMRTPPANAAAIAAQLSRVQILTVDAGHDVLHVDKTGCVQDALARFAADQPVADACAGRAFGPRVAPRPPARLRDVTPVQGMHGVRGRVVAAVRATLADAVRMVLFAHWDKRALSGDGLLSGTLSVVGGKLSLTRYRNVPGVSLTGGLVWDNQRLSGRMNIRGRQRGWLRLSRDGALRGTLAGRSVRIKAPPIRLDI